MLADLTDQNIIELIGNTYKIKQTQGHTLTDNTQVESITMIVPETQNTTRITSFARKRKNHQNLHLLYLKRLKKNPWYIIGSTTYS